MSELIKNIIAFDEARPYDMILLGRVAIDFNPIDYFKTLAESREFKKYIGGSPANTAVGLARLGKKCGFFSRVSDDRFGDYAVEYFREEGIDTSHIFRCGHGEKLGLTFTEILSPTESSILLYRNDAADLSLEPADIDEEYKSTLLPPNPFLFQVQPWPKALPGKRPSKQRHWRGRQALPLFLILTTVLITGKALTKLLYTIPLWPGRLRL